MKRSVVVTIRFSRKEMEELARYLEVAHERTYGYEHDLG